VIVEQMLRINGIIKGLISFLIIVAPLSLGFGQILSLPEQEHDKVRGFSIGTFKLVPMLGVEGGWDSNIFRLAKSESPKSAGLILPEGGLKLYNPNASKVLFSLSGVVNYRHYFSNDSAVKSQNQLGAVAAMKFKLFPRGHFGLDVEDTYKRTVEPRNYSNTNNLNRHENSAMLKVSIRPGGGSLIFDLFYGNILERYDNYSNGNMLSHKTGAVIRWDFLPKTSLLIEANVRFNKYSNNNPLKGNVESHPLITRIGMVGYITPKLILDMRIGFAKGFYKTGSDYGTVIGRAVLGYAFTPTTILEVGYRRLFEDSYYSNYYGMHHAYLSFKQQIWNKLNINIGVAYNYLMYASYSPTAASGYKVSSTNRRDNLLEADLGINFSILRYLAVRVSYKFYKDFTDFSLTAPNNSVDDSSYMRHNVMGGIRLYY